MDTLMIQNYIAKTLGIDIILEATKIPQMPYAVRMQFDFFRTDMFGKTICFLVPSKNDIAEYPIQDVERAAQLVTDFDAGLPVFVFLSLSKYNRLMLIRRKLSFIVPDLQMFLPYLAIDLYDRIPDAVPHKQESLRPAAQAVLIEQLLNGSLQGLSINKIASIMRYTAMGTLRAINQLHELKLCCITVTGASKVVTFSDNRKKLWNDAMPYLRNPVKKTVAIESDLTFSGYPFAGEYALHNHSDLSVSRKCYAIHQTQFSNLMKKEGIILADSQKSGIADLQIWTYTLPSWRNEVDLLSLELSFKGNSDPRIKIAFLNIEEQRTW